MAASWPHGIAVLLAAATLLAAAPSFAHSGGLDAKGCHWRHQRVKDDNGVEREVATDYHCHRALDGGLRLDGREVLPEAPTSPPPAPPAPPRP